MTRQSARLFTLIAENNIKKCSVVIKKHEETQQKCRELVFLKGIKAPKRVGARRATVTQDRDINSRKALIDLLEQDPGNDSDEAAPTPMPARILTRRATEGVETDVRHDLVSDQSSRIPLRALNSPGQSETEPKPERQKQPGADVPVDLTIDNRVSDESNRMPLRALNSPRQSETEPEKQM